MGVAKYANGFDVTLHPSELEIPLKWKQPRRVFVNSMSDLFHESIPNEFIHEVFAVMRRAPQHQFQVLTKRSERLQDLAPQLEWSPNIWMGVSVETEVYSHRIDHLRTSPAHIKFLSLEPLLGPLLHLDLKHINWVIVGGESGPGARPMREEWVIDIKSQCNDKGVAFFFKQWGGVNKKRAGRTLEGRTWDQMPAHMPTVA